MIDQVSQLDIRVYLEDTDAGGIVFYANYLKYFERGRTEFFRERNFELRQGLKENINYVVHSLEVKYHRSAFLDDQLSVQTSIKEIGKTFIVFKQKVLNKQTEIITEADIKIVCLHFDTAKPRKLPDSLLTSIS